MSTRHHLFPALLVSALLAGCATTTIARPSHTVHKTLVTTQALPAGTRVKIENLVGYVQVRQGGSQLDVTADVVAGGSDQAAAQTLANSIRLVTSHHGNQLIIHVHYPVNRHDSYQYIPTQGAPVTEHSMRILGFTIGSSSNTRTQYQGQRVSVYRGRDEGVPLHVDLVISLPAGSQASIRNHMGLIAANNVNGTLSLNNDSGDIHANHVDGALTIAADSGDTTVADTRGSLTVDSDSGDVKIRNANGDLKVDADSGDVFVNDAHGDTLTLNADSGDIHLDAVSGSLRLDADSGDIWLKNLGNIPHLHAEADSGDVHASGKLSGIQSFDLATDSGDVILTSRQPPAVHLDIQASDVEVKWAGVHNVQQDDDHYGGDIGTATGTGRINTDDGSVVLKP